MDCSCQRIGVVRVNVGTPDSTAETDLLAFIFGKVKSRNTDCQGAIFLALEARDGKSGACIDDLGVERLRCRRVFNSWRVEDRAKVLSWELADTFEDLIVVYSRGRDTRSSLVPF